MMPMQFRDWVIAFLCLIIAVLLLEHIGKWPSSLFGSVLWGAAKWMIDEQELDENETDDDSTAD